MDGRAGPLKVPLFFDGFGRALLIDGSTLLAPQEKKLAKSEGLVERWRI